MSAQDYKDAIDILVSKPINYERIVVELVKQRLAGNFEVAEIVAMPDDAHHIDVVKGNG